MEIGQYAIKNLTLRPCSLQCICSDFNPINKENIAVQMCSLIGCLGLMAWEHERFSSHLFDALSNWLHSGDQSAKISWLVLEPCWKYVSAVKAAVFKPTVLDERLVEEQKDVFEMWGVLSSSESHFFFLHRHEAVANAVVFVKWGSEWFLDTILGKLVNICKDSLIVIFFSSWWLDRRDHNIKRVLGPCSLEQTVALLS